MISQVKYRCCNREVCYCLAWMLIVVIVTTLIHSRVSAFEWGDYSNKQPNLQLRSKVHHNPNLNDSFFHSAEYGIRYYSGTRLGGGYIIPEDSLDWAIEQSGQVKEENYYPSLRHTARCFSNSRCSSVHEVRFCKARLREPGFIDIIVLEDNPADDDNLFISVKNGTFMCRYWTVYKRRSKINPERIWTTMRQSLTLNKQKFRKGDEIKGRINFECVEEPSNPAYIKKHGKYHYTIKVVGVFKTMVE